MQDDVKLDMLSELTLVLQLVKGAPSRERRLVINLVWDMLNKKGMKDQDAEDVRLLLRKLDIIADLQQNLIAACDCRYNHLVKH